METPKWVRSELHCKMFEIFSTGTLPSAKKYLLAAGIDFIIDAGICEAILAN